MTRLTLGLSMFSLLLCASALVQAQSVARVNQPTSEVGDGETNAQAIAALKRLEKDVIVYRSLADFQESGKLARVPLQTFQQELSQVTREVEPAIMRMPASRLKIKLANALDPVRDGAYWRRKEDQP